jgi:LmbE family N-acetylglucosaminyl deacetylase/GT2 family glycosyltransferase
MPSYWLILPVLVAASALGGSVAWTLRRRRAWQRRHFPLGRGTPGRFVAGRSLTSLPLARTSDGGWQLPSLAAADSALLVIEGEAGNDAPRVNLVSGNACSRHYTPSGWAGSWNIDATPLRSHSAATPTRATLVDLTIKDPPALWVSTERPRAGERILILSPHPDDAELATFGFYARHGAQVHIVTLTAGEKGAGFTSSESAETTYARATKRARESCSIPELGGVARTRCHNFLLPDGDLTSLLADLHQERALPYDRVQLAQALGGCAIGRVTGDHWIAGLRHLVDRIDPAIIVCPDLLRDDHPDHRATAAALALALQRKPITSLRAIYLYVVHSTYSDLAPFGPVHAPWDPAPAIVDTTLDAFYSELLDDALLARKLQAVEACSDVDAFVRTSPAFRPGLGEPAAWSSPDPSSLIRRCVRRTEWFRVLAPSQFAPAPRFPSSWEGSAAVTAPVSDGKTVPRVSILIPAFNAGPWIERCIHSALGQTLSPLEVLVHDDGSTDNTRAIIARFGERVRFFSGPNLGGNRVRNRLLAAAQGDWVQFLDADDELLPDKIERQFTEAGRLDEIDVIYSPTIDEIWQGGQRVSAHPTTVSVESDQFVQWIRWQISQTNGSLWRRSALESIGGWNEAQPCCQDNELYARALREGLRLRFAPSARSIHRTWSAESVSTRNPLLVVQERARLTGAMAAWLRATARWNEAHATATGRVFFELARTWARFDLAGAAKFYRTQKTEGSIRPSGNAAPFGYGLLLALLGFVRTESLLRQRRALAHRSSP